MSPSYGLLGALEWVLWSPCEIFHNFTFLLAMDAWQITRQITIDNVGASLLWPMKVVWTLEGRTWQMLLPSKHLPSQTQSALIAFQLHPVHSFPFPLPPLPWLHPTLLWSLPLTKCIPSPSPQIGALHLQQPESMLWNVIGECYKITSTFFPVDSLITQCPPWIYACYFAGINSRWGRV